MNSKGKATSTAKDSVYRALQGDILPESEIISELKGCLSDHQRKALDGVSWYVYGISGSGRTHTGAIAALVQAVENHDDVVRIYDHSCTDYHAMAIVGDHVEMLLEHFSENIQGMFKIDKSKPKADSGLPVPQKITKPVRISIPFYLGENPSVMDAIAMNGLSAGLAMYKFRNNNGLCTF